MYKMSMKITVTVAVMAGMGGAAFAAGSAAGIGIDDVLVGDPAQITVNQTSIVTGLAPGSAAQPLKGNFDNPNEGPVYINHVTATVIAVKDATGHALPGCDASDFSLAGTGAVNAVVPKGLGVGSWDNLTIAFNNKADTNQDACQNARVAIGYMAN